MISLKKGLRWQIGDGKSVRFWSDNWLFPYPINSIVTPTADTVNILVSDCFSAPGQWNISLLLSLVPPHIVSLISSIYLPQFSQVDKLVWGLTADGEYSVKSGALLAQGCLPANPVKVQFSWIWSLSVPPKIKNFLWKTCNDGLPTKSRLEKSHIFLPQQCVFCNSCVESIGHLCFACPFTIDVFQHLKASFDWPVPPTCLQNIDLSSFRSALEACLSLASKENISFYAFVWWFVWFFRNKLIFNDGTISSRKASFLISNFASSWLRVSSFESAASISSKAKPSKVSKKRSGPNLLWDPPRSGFFKLNFDGSKLPNGSASLGFIIRDSAGDAILVGGRSMGSNISILQAEAWALKEGMAAACSLNISNLVIEGDNLAVINAVRKVWNIPWEINNIISDIMVNLSSFSEFQVRHCFREANRVADAMARRAHQFPLLQIIYPPFDIDISMLIRKDVLGWPPD